MARRQPRSEIDREEAHLQALLAKKKADTIAKKKVKAMDKDRYPKDTDGTPDLRKMISNVRKEDVVHDDGGNISVNSPEEINTFSAETSYSFLMAGKNDPLVAQICSLLHDRATRREVSSLLDTIFYLLIHIDSKKLIESEELMDALSVGEGDPRAFTFEDKGNYGTTVRQLVNAFIHKD